ncbi:glycosyltransferase family 2 protein, partial [Candidatus Bathyarchaeota archaeon]|nr:glycosyltransferase family 2 protein [Candidatus Bathyarchaeota archaeon]
FLSTLNLLIEGFNSWLQRLTPIDFFMILWPLLIFDFTRSIGKCLILLAHSLYRKVKPEHYVAQNFSPKLSLIIPAHNEEKIIVRAIEAALEADYDQKEIIVVDDGSRDRTYELAYSYAKRGLIKLFRRDVASGSKAGALNFGLLFATGDTIVTVDADTLIERNSLKEIVKPLSNPSVSAVSGNVMVLRGEHGANNLLVKLQAYEYLVSLELGRRFNALINTLLIISGAFGAFWKKHVASLGQYDSDTITEDFDVTLKVRKLGKRLTFADKAISWTFTPETWRDWRRQRIRWSRGQIESLWKHRNIFFGGKFDLMLILAVYDMVLMDIFLLFIRLGWFIYVFIYMQQTLLYIIILSIIIYLAIELIVLLTAGALSPRKTPLKNIYLVPVMTLLYRPYYSVIRLKAYLEWIIQKQSAW